MTGLEIALGLAAIILPILTYFAGVQRTKHRFQQDDTEERINRTVDEYQKIFQPRKDSGLPALIEAGVLLLNSDSEIRETCSRLEARNGDSPLTPYIDELVGVDLLAFFKAVREHGINPRLGDCVKLAKEKLG